MARQPRNRSETGIYHIMLRGINRQRIFEESPDYEQFLWCLERVQEDSGMIIYAYVLMSNHVHLLIGEGREALSVTMKRLTVRYAGWFNRKYDRVGHLFQDRFASRPVDDDGYFLMALMYIHFNPVVGGLCTRPDQYMWSSRRTLGHPGSLVDSTSLERIVPLETVMREEGRYEPAKVDPRDILAYPEENNHVSDDEAWELISRTSGTESGTEFQRLSVSEQEHVVRTVRSQGVSIRQLSRLTGLNRGLILRWGSREIPIYEND